VSDVWENLQEQNEYKNEATVETRFVLPLLAALGYALEDIAPKYGVVFQQGRSGRHHEADFVVFSGPAWSRETSLIVVEAKKPGESFQKAKEQAESYAANVRAPFLIITDGTGLQVWQLQPALESQLIVDAQVQNLVGFQPQLEATLGKPAAIAYCKTLSHKTVIDFSDDFSEYILAELARSRHSHVTIARTLKGTSQIWQSTELRQSFPAGAIVVAPSGFGKSYLAVDILRDALQARAFDGQQPLAVEVPLADLAHSTQNLLQFVCDRVKAHHPGFTDAAMKHMLREGGIVLACDGFDKIANDRQGSLGSEFRNFCRDYPNSQLFVFSRSTHALSLPLLPTLSLEGLTQTEQSRLADLRLGPHAWRFFGAAPALLNEIRTVPLIFSLLLDFWVEHEKLPRSLLPLFDRWIDELTANPDSIQSTVVRQSALLALAAAAADSALSAAEAVTYVKEAGLDAGVLDELVASGAVIRTGSAIELVHDSIGDFLRAKAISTMSESEAVLAVQALRIQAGSLLPVFLLAMLTHSGPVSLLWKRLPSIDLDTYFSALRYRRDLSCEVPDDVTRASELFLREMLQGVMFPLEGPFHNLRAAVIEDILDGPAAGIRLDGQIDAAFTGVAYSTTPSQMSEGEIHVGGLTPTRWSSLPGFGYRLDDGRVMGTKILRESVLSVAANGRLAGGPLWRMERLLSRTRHLTLEHGFAFSETELLSEIASRLESQRNRYVPTEWGGKALYPIDEIFEDIDALQANGKSKLAPWWHECGMTGDTYREPDDVLQRYVDAFYRRLMSVYHEVMERSFPALCEDVGLYSSLPLHWDVTITRALVPYQRVTLYPRPRPVATWGESGATAVVSGTPPSISRDSFEKFAAQLGAVGRKPAKRYGLPGFFPLPALEGYHRLNGSRGETPVFKMVIDMVTDDLNRIFEDFHCPVPAL